MGIKTNELQQLSSILGTDSLLADTAAAGTGRVSAAALAQFMDAELLKSGTGLSTQLGNKADKSAQQTLEAVSVPTRTVTLTAAELQSYISALPKYLAKVEELVVDGGEINAPLSLTGFFGPGFIIIRSNGSDNKLKLKKGIAIGRCEVNIQFLQLEISGLSTQLNPPECAHISNAVSVTFSMCDFVGTSNTGCAVSADKGSCVTLAECTISGWYQAGLAMTTAIVNIFDCTCNGNTYGAQVWGGGIILLSGSTPELMGGASHILQGGMIVRKDGTPYEPLELTTFPYASGITYEQGYGQHYWRQGRTVCLSVLAYLPACQKSQWLLIGTLPEGFRPEKTINDIAAIFRPDSVAAVEISSATGEVRVWPHVDIPNSGTSSYDKPYCFISTCFAVSQ